MPPARRGLDTHTPLSPFALFQRAGVGGSGTLSDCLRHRAQGKPGLKAGLWPAELEHPLLNGRGGGGVSRLAKHQPRRAARTPGRPRPLPSSPRTPRERGPGDVVTEGPWSLARPTCLVGAVLARVPAGPRRAPPQPRRHQGRRLIHARLATGGAAPGTAAAASGARALPCRPR